MVTNTMIFYNRLISDSYKKAIHYNSIQNGGKIKNSIWRLKFHIGILSLDIAHIGYFGKHSRRSQHLSRIKHIDIASSSKKFGLGIRTISVENLADLSEPQIPPNEQKDH